MKAEDITNAVCAECGRPVRAKASISGLYVLEEGNIKRYIFSRVYTYWDCEAHGAVWAIVDGELVKKPSELFDSLEFEDWGVKIYREEEK